MASEAVVLRYEVPVLAPDGTAYRACARGRERSDDHLWEAWIEFAPIADSDAEAVATPRETTQPSLGAAEYWATGLSHVFLEGALVRAFDAAFEKT
jgi:hypothetical protein